MIHETELIRSFFVKEKTERYLKLLSSKKGRAKFRLILPHLKDLELTCLHSIKSSDQNEKFIIEYLKKNKAPLVCYVIAEHPDYDQKSMLIEEALQSLFASGIGYFISCIPGKLAYYEGEEFNERYFLF